MRFPEFTGEWEVKKLGEVMEFIKDKLPSASLSTKNYVSTENLLQDFQGITLASSIPSNVNVTAYKAHDILFSNIRPYLKKIWKANLSGGCSSDVFVFRNNESCLSGFLYYSIANEDFINYVMIGAKGVKMPRGDKEQIQQYPISLPSLTEQAKIVSFLSLIDERILTQIKIIEGLKELKVSLSKQIFSRKLRFKDENDRDFPEWEEKSLGEVGDVKMCKRIFNEQTTPEGDIPFYKIGSFGRKADAYISKDLYLEYKNKFSFPKKGEILISAAGTIGRTVVYNGEDAYYQDSNIVWIQNDNTVVSNEFLYYILQIVKYNTEGGTIQRLYNNILRTTKFNCPSLAEQFKIANFLSNIDSKIEAETKTYELLTKQKQSLLRQMFI